MYSPISWPGSKRRLSKLIIPLLPPHTAYVEPFGGSLAVLLAKERSEIEVVNDLNSELVSFYRCTRFHREALLDELELVLNAREEFLDFGEQPGLTDIQRAARWFLRNKLSFGGKGGHYGTSKTSGGGAANSSRANRLQAIRALSERLDRVNIEHLDWRRLLDVYDAPTTCFYLDPPYTRGMQYEGLSWTMEDHVELRDRLRGLAGMWVLSYDESEVVRELYAGCTFVAVDRAAGIGNNTGRKGRRYHEVIITPAPVI